MLFSYSGWYAFSHKHDGLCENVPVYTDRISACHGIGFQKDQAYSDGSGTEKCGIGNF